MSEGSCTLRIDLVNGYIVQNIHLTSLSHSGTTHPDIPVAALPQMCGVEAHIFALHIPYHGDDPRSIRCGTRMSVLAPMVLFVGVRNQFGLREEAQEATHVRHRNDSRASTRFLR